jgi:hypothetical protein
MTQREASTYTDHLPGLPGLSTDTAAVLLASEPNTIGFGGITGRHSVCLSG